MKKTDWWRAIWGMALMAGISGCAEYKPAPLDTGKGERELLGRSLSDERLNEWVREGESETGTTRPAVEASGMKWTLARLTRAAWYLNPELDVARAHVAAVAAGQITAGQSPNPTAGFVPFFSTNPDGMNPWTLGFTLDVPIETAGKRGHRIAESEALTDAARLELAEAMWRVRSRVREALSGYLLDEQAAEIAGKEMEARGRYVGLLESRLAAGEAARPEVDRARVDLLTSRQSWRAAQGQVAASRTRLASAIGMPASGLDGAVIDWGSGDMDRLEGMDAQTAKELQGAALRNRLDVRRELVEYAAAEAALRLEVAKQYPDLHLGPGYEFDQGQNKWSVGLSVELPVVNQNQGPIAEATAHRTELAAKFLALQAQVIGETDAAMAQYAGAQAELDGAQEQVSAVGKRLEAARRSLEAGGEDRLTVTGVEVEYWVAMRLQVDAVRKAQEARGAIEDAIQRPLPDARGASQPAATSTSPAGKPEEPES